MTSARAAAAEPTLTALAHPKYRPDIDGLRAVAVLSVVVFHLKRQWFPGGFVGVDIFFVISGYLITRLLQNDFDVGHPSYARFYQRRIARIFPAFFAVAIATIMASGFVFLPQDFASAGANLVAASLSVLNLKQILQGSYFEASPDAQPLLHYWSLSVEEQYYIVYPLLLFFLFRHIRRYVSTVLIVIGVASFLLWLFFANSRPVWAFYLLPTRAWELCAGCLVAASRVGKQDGDLLSKWLPYAGVLLVGISLLVIHEGHAFPGWVAIVPVCGAVALIVSGGTMDGWIIRWLSSRAMAATGRCPIRSIFVTGQFSR